MNYTFSKTVEGSFENAIEKVTQELKKEGFGVLTEIDVKETLKNKLGVDFRKYKILGACNPHFAHQALLHESEIGSLLPCNVVVQENADNQIRVSAIDPVESMKAVDNPELGKIAMQVREKLKKVIEEF